MGYLNYVGAEMKKSWTNAVVVVVFTVCRLLFGWGWFSGGWDKIFVEHWLNDGKFTAGGEIQKMITSVQHSHGTDPLHLNNLLVWAASHIFIHLGGLMDFLVVACEILIGVTVFFGFGMVWGLVVALFLNLQFDSAGAANNFGYIVTDVVWLMFPKYANLIGVDGYLRYRKEQGLTGTGTSGPRLHVHKHSA